MDQILESSRKLFAEDHDGGFSQAAAVRAPMRRLFGQVGVAAGGKFGSGPRAGIRPTARGRGARTGPKVTVAFHQLVIGHSSQAFQAINI